MTRRWAGRAATNAKRWVLTRDHGICQLCQHPGANSLDHIVSTYERPDLMWDPANWQAVHLARAGKPNGCQLPSCSCVGNHGKHRGSNAAAVELSRQPADPPADTWGPTREW